MENFIEIYDSLKSLSKKRKNEIAKSYKKRIERFEKLWRIANNVKYAILAIMLIPIGAILIQYKQITTGLTLWAISVLYFSFLMIVERMRGKIPYLKDIVKEIENS
jgi:uncharacterized membrane protein YbaN (DUF454 family)